MRCVGSGLYINNKIGRDWERDLLNSKFCMLLVYTCIKKINEVNNNITVLTMSLMTSVVTLMKSVMLNCVQNAIDNISCDTDEVRDITCVTDDVHNVIYDFNSSADKVN